MRLVTIAALLTVTGLASTSVAQAAFPGRNGAIAISGWGGGRNGDDTYSWVSARTEGGASSGILHCPPGECPGVFAPAYTPSGERVAVQYGTALAILRLDGTVVRRLPQVAAVDTKPSFSPDGRRLVFEGQREPNGRGDVYAVGVDGKGLRRLTFGGAGYKPVWSTGNRIAYAHCTRRRLASCEVRTMSPSGRRSRRVVKRAGAPTWSPDGRRLAVERYGPAVKEEGDRRTRIWIVDRNGSRARRVTGRPGYAPAWSPDGKRLAFRTHRYEDGDPVSFGSEQKLLLTMDLRGGARRAITEIAGTLSDFTSRPDWQPLRRRP